ncbi:sulfate adenylyltransferase [Striga asiatica]|uniref:Sulfate adenylyltransferase n=1 Tax=Striga asiatica TaxID=4170 RepID=A0A5A7Q977_STRAF|nr:sulfate adenylyltransferase [Striga asiatica]
MVTLLSLFTSSSLIFLSFLLGSSLLLTTDVHPIMLEVPLLERRSINLNKSTLNQSLGRNQLIIGRVINDVQNTSLPGDSLTAPREVSCVQPQCTPLHITSTDPHPADSLVARKLCVCGLSFKLVLSLLPPSLLLSSSRTPLVHGIPRNTHGCRRMILRSRRITGPPMVPVTSGEKQRSPQREEELEKKRRDDVLI